MCRILLMLTVFGLITINGHAQTSFIEGKETGKIELFDVSSDGDSCGILVDGTMGWISQGYSDVINDVEIKVLRAIPVLDMTRDNDMCEVMII